VNTRAIRLVAAFILVTAIVALARPASAQSPEEDPLATPTPLQVGLEHILAGELIAEDGGEDLYSFEATARTQYIIEVKAEIVFDAGDEGAPSFVPPHLKDPSILRIEDSNGVQVLGEQDRGGFTLNWARAFFTPAADDTYTVAVGSGAQERGGFGRYTITVRADDHADDYRANPTVVLRPGRLIAGVINSDVSPGDPRLNWWDWLSSPSDEGTSRLSGLRPRRGIESLDDRDVFPIEIPEAGNYRVTLFELPEFVRLWFIWDGNGNLWAELPREFVNAYSLAFDPGTYFVEVGTPAESSGQTRRYHLLLEPAPVADEVAECAATSSTPCSIQVGQSKTGLADGIHDEDWWSVDLEPGKTLKAQLRGAGDESGDADNGGTLEDPFLTLYGPSGTPLASNDNVAPDNLNARLVYTVPEDAGGRYHLSARANSGGGFSFATYTISVDEVAEALLDEQVDCSGTQPATCSLNVGECRPAGAERMGPGGSKKPVAGGHGVLTSGPQACSPILATGRPLCIDVVQAGPPRDGCPQAPPCHLERAVLVDLHVLYCELSAGQSTCKTLFARP